MGKKLVDYENEIMDSKVDDNIIDLDLSVTAKKQFRINGDNNKILELNTSDMNIAVRLEEVLEKLGKLTEQATEVSMSVSEDMDDEMKLSEISKALKEIDTEMRGLVDYLFDSNVSELCAENGSMFDPFDGVLRYEHIINSLTKLYENNINSEYRKIQKRVSKHTDKYIK